MKDLVKNLLKEGIDEKMIHRILDLVEECDKDGKYKEALKKAKEMNAEKVLKATQEYRKDIKDKTNK